ncbi:MAG: hypothetical protein WC123_07910 [Bacilli bacterium]
MTEQSKHYEQAGDLLKKDEAVKAYRAAQNHLDSTNPNYLQDFKKLQEKIINTLPTN